MLLLSCGCDTVPKGEHGPDGTIAYYIQVESSAPARIEVNNDYLGDTPYKLKVFGDRDGTFHNFGSMEYVIKALPKDAAPGVFPQSKVFRTGGWFSQEDKIPTRVYFDMSQKATPETPVALLTLLR
jgi:hypothetical protein